MIMHSAVTFKSFFILAENCESAWSKISVFCLFGIDYKAVVDVQHNTYMDLKESISGEESDFREKRNALMFPCIYHGYLNKPVLPPRNRHALHASCSNKTTIAMH